MINISSIKPAANAKWLGNVRWKERTRPGTRAVAERVYRAAPRYAVQNAAKNACSVAALACVLTAASSHQVLAEGGEDLLRQQKAIERVEQAITALPAAPKAALTGELESTKRVLDALSQKARLEQLDELAVLAETATASPNWANFKRARQIAILHAVRKGTPVDSVSYLTPGAAANFDKVALARQIGLPAEFASRMEVYPVGLGNEPTIRLPGGQSDGLRWMVGGTPVVEFSPTLLEQTGSSLPARYALAPGGIAHHQNATLMVRSGKPEDMSNELAREFADTSPRFGSPVSLPTVDGATCDRAGNTVDCFLPTVALHDRWRTYCTGVLVSRRWVLSAAHCFCDHLPTRMTIGGRAGTRLFPDQSPRISIDLGHKVHYLDSKFCTAFRLYQRKQGSYPPQDLALADLIEDVPLNRPDLFASIVKHTGFSLPAGVKIAGFGRTRTNSRGGEKREAPFVTDDPACGGLASDCNAETEFTTSDHRSRVDSCHGDSGAGVFDIRFPDKLVLVGIVSRGIETGCGPGGINTRVTTEAVQEWLKSHVPSVKFVPLATAVAGAGAIEN